MAKKFERTIPGHPYTLTFGRKQTERIGRAACIKGVSPETFIRDSALKGARDLIDAADTVNKPK